MTINKLPGQSQAISSDLKLLLEKVSSECSRKIRFIIGPAESDCESSAEWTDIEIIIKMTFYIPRSLSNLSKRTTYIPFAKLKISSI